MEFAPGSEPSRPQRGYESIENEKRCSFASRSLPESVICWQRICRISICGKSIVERSRGSTFWPQLSRVNALETRRKASERSDSHPDCMHVSKVTSFIFSTRCMLATSSLFQRLAQSRFTGTVIRFEIFYAKIFLLPGILERNHTQYEINVVL